MCLRIEEEQNLDTLRRWYLSAPGAGSFDEFRKDMELFRPETWEQEK